MLAYPFYIVDTIEPEEPGIATVFQKDDVTVMHTLERAFALLSPPVDQPQPLPFGDDVLEFPALTVHRD